MRRKARSAPTLASLGLLSVSGGDSRIVEVKRIHRQHEENRPYGSIRKLVCQ